MVSNRSSPILAYQTRDKLDFNYYYHSIRSGQTAPRQPAVNQDEQMIVHKEEILDPEDNDENQQVVLAGI